MRYFAYGSNMFELRLKDPARAPSASYRVTGLIRGYQLRFHKVGMDGSAKCDAFLTGNLRDCVYGVVFDISSKDVGQLDEAEGVSQGGYSRAQVNMESSDDSSQLLAHCYFANQGFIDDKLLPFHWYKALVVAGAYEHNLPGWYIQRLQQLPSKEDRDQERRQKALDLLGPLVPRS